MFIWKLNDARGKVLVNNKKKSKNPKKSLFKVSKIKL